MCQFHPTSHLANNIPLFLIFLILKLTFFSILLSVTSGLFQQNFPPK
jgi:hypothetical protein